MKRRSRTIWAAGISTGCVAIALLLLPAFLRGHDFHRGSPSSKLVVHEWGTFTSFAGSNGVNLEFRPLVTNDLPKFIINPSNAQPWVKLLTKSQYVGLQRMETPVTYFYTDVPRVVNVRVDFPKGMLTEWFPAVKDLEAGAPTAEQAMGRAYLDWGAVRLIPPEQFANVRVNGLDRSGRAAAVPAWLPEVAENDHYGRARETDSAIVETVDSLHYSHFEKFLFYRGLGNFELPIKLVALGNDRFEVANSAEDASGALLLVHIDSGHVRFVRLGPVSPRSSIEISLPDSRTTIDRLVAATVRELTAAGLYEKEALAMVNTWRDNWFGEDGTRLLYLVPGKLTD